MDSRLSPFTSIRKLVTTAAIILCVATISGIATAAFSGPEATDSTQSTPTTVQISSTTAPASTSTGPIASSTTAIPPPTDFSTSFIDTSDENAARSAWKLVNSRPRHRMNWTGSVRACRAGKTDNLFKEDVLYRVQWFRAMAGVNPVISLNDESNRLAQEAALVMAAAGDLSHEPDSSWPCYSQDAYDGASHSNLSLGDFGVQSIDGYIEDPGSDNYPVGHRRWILDPTLLTIGTGDTRNTNALFVISSDTRKDAQTREEDGYVMWPPRGYVPRSQIYERWSISHQTADFSSAVVAVSQNGRTQVFENPYSDTAGYGRMNSLVFRWPRPSKGSGPIKVTISNIEKDGLFTSFEYEVRAFG